MFLSFSINSRCEKLSPVRLPSGVGLKKLSESLQELAAILNLSKQPLAQSTLTTEAVNDQTFWSFWKKTINCQHVWNEKIRNCETVRSRRRSHHSIRSTIAFTETTQPLSCNTRLWWEVFSRCNLCFTHMLWKAWAGQHSNEEERISGSREMEETMKLKRPRI